MKINSKVKISSRNAISEIPGAWSAEDYKKLLESFGIEDEMSEEEVKGMLFMAMSDEKPEDSASIVLAYRLGEELNEGQIQKLSHEIQEDKVSEEYSDIFLHHELFNINQLLFKGYNGRFPSCKAIEVVFQLEVDSVHFLDDKEWKNEVLLRSLQPAFGGRSAMERLYDEEMEGKKKFTDADGIVWKSDIQKTGANSFAVKLYSSEFWFHDLPMQGEFDASFKLAEED